jgi:hypothetical protein
MELLEGPRYSTSLSGETSQQYWGSSLNESLGYFRTDSSESWLESSMKFEKNLYLPKSSLQPW